MKKFITPKIEIKEFKTVEIMTTSITTPPTTTESVTDADGWVTKWY